MAQLLQLAQQRQALARESQQQEQLQQVRLWLHRQQ
jgi:hypothetical protein